MFSNKIFIFSPCGEYFVSKNEDEILTVWETSSNDIKQEYNVDADLNTSCTALIWGTFKNNPLGKDDASKESQFLIIGTKDGKIYMYDYCNGKIIPYFDDRHSASVNDLSLDSDSSRLFSCSSDKSIILWDITSGKINQKWNSGEHELFSICVIDNNNLLTGSTSILWWNIKEQKIMKEFSCHNTPVSLLRVVNSMNVSSSPSYFLSAAVGESKICAWSMNKKNHSINAVASFGLPCELQNIDSNTCFSKDNPLLLTATTKSGALVLFQHVLNGKTKSLVPEMTLQVMNKNAITESESSSIPVISSKILDCAESCIIAYGPDNNPVFESVNIFECPKTLTLSREEPAPRKCNRLNSNPKVKQRNSVIENHIVNGQTSTFDSPYNSPKRRKLKKSSDEVNPNPQTENIDFNYQTSIYNRISPKSSPSVKKKHKLFKKQEEMSISSESDSDDVPIPSDPSEMANFLIRGIEEEKQLLVKSVLHCNDGELIRNCVRNLPLSKLKTILLELSRRLPLKEKRYSHSLRKWLKEILSIHLPYLITCEDLTDILEKIKEYLEKKRVNETLLKMNMLRGLLKIQIQSLSATESSSDTDEECLKT